MDLLLTYLITFLFLLSGSGDKLGEIIKSHFDAINQKGLISIRSLDIRGSNFFYRNHQTFKSDDPFLAGTFRRVIYKNDRYYEKIDDKVVDGEQKFQIEYCLSGEDSWRKDNQGVSDWIRGSADSIDISTLIDIEGPLYNWQEKGHLASFLGKRKIEGNSYYCVELALQHGRKIYYYIDPRSGYIKWRTNFKEISAEYKYQVFYYSDYRSVNGVYFPFYIESRSLFMNDTNYVVRKYDSIIQNRKVDDQIFNRPKD